MSDDYDLAVDLEIAASAEACFDAFIDLYDGDRPDWVTESDLDLRVGGRWHVRFDPSPDPPFREERTITDVQRPYELGYHARIQDDAGHERFSTQVLVTFTDSRQNDDTPHTLVALTQTGFEDAATRDEFAANWPGVLAELDRRLSGDASRR
jgi:uncharacterized protein YndB with AHSA1/START domain